MPQRHDLQGFSRGRHDQSLHHRELRQPCGHLHGYGAEQWTILQQHDVVRWRRELFRDEAGNRDSVLRQYAVSEQSVRGRRLLRQCLQRGGANVRFRSVPLRSRLSRLRRTVCSEQ
jgi:hypothetical protein